MAAQSSLLAAFARSNSATRPSEFYAVRRGRQPGIYSTWDECQRQISGFAGAEYRKFTVSGLFSVTVIKLQSKVGAEAFVRPQQPAVQRLSDDAFVGVFSD